MGVYAMSTLRAVREEYYTLAEVLEIVGVTRMSVWKWRRSGRLKTYPLGRETLIKKADIERICRERGG